jgi:6-phosphogluconate dehydrogenase (decarboxylating)
MKLGMIGLGRMGALPCPPRGMELIQCRSVDQYRALIQRLKS